MLMTEYDSSTVKKNPMLKKILKQETLDVFIEPRVSASLAEIQPTCMICGRSLTDPKSIEKGMGSDCEQLFTQVRFFINNDVPFMDSLKRLKIKDLTIGKNLLLALNETTNKKLGSNVRVLFTRKKASNKQKYLIQFNTKEISLLELIGFHPKDVVTIKKKSNDGSPSSFEVTREYQRRFTGKYERSDRPGCYTMGLRLGYQMANDLKLENSVTFNIYVREGRLNLVPLCDGRELPYYLEVVHGLTTEQENAQLDNLGVFGDVITDDTVSEDIRQMMRLFEKILLSLNLETLDDEGMLHRVMNSRKKGSAWELLVQEHFDSIKKCVSELSQLKETPLFGLEVTNLKIAENGVRRKKKKKYVFDAYCPESSIIIEAKFSVAAFKRKEIEYLYDNPDAILIYLLFDPPTTKNSNNQVDSFLIGLMKTMVEDFNRNMKVNFLLELDEKKREFKRVKFYGRNEIGLGHITVTELLHYQKKIALNYAKILVYLEKYQGAGYIARRDIIEGTKIPSTTAIRVLEYLEQVKLVKKTQTSSKKGNSPSKRSIAFRLVDLCKKHPLLKKAMELITDALELQEIKLYPPKRVVDSGNEFVKTLYRRNDRCFSATITFNTREIKLLEKFGFTSESDVVMVVIDEQGGECESSFEFRLGKIISYKGSKARLRMKLSLSSSFVRKYGFMGREKLRFKLEPLRMTIIPESSENDGKRRFLFIIKPKNENSTSL